MNTSKIGVVDYGMGNLRSVTKALERLGVASQVTRGPDDLATCDRVILPGVGAFRDGISNLTKRGYVDALNEYVLVRGRPILGICLGMQLFMDESEEGGVFGGLGYLPGRVRSFDPALGLRIPHMGWNSVKFCASNPLTDGLSNGGTFYFVHGYYVECKDPSSVTGVCEYGEQFAAVTRKNLIFGLQFHPEKSHETGFEILSRFINARLD